MWFVTARKGIVGSSFESSRRRTGSFMLGIVEKQGCVRGTEEEQRKEQFSLSSWLLRTGA